MFIIDFVVFELRKYNFAILPVRQTETTCACVASS